MKTPLLLTTLLLVVAAFGQQSAKPVYGGVIGQAGQLKGVIHGNVIDQDGQPAKGLMLTARWHCPGICAISESRTRTNQNGEYRFENLAVGRYQVFADDEKAGYSDYISGFADGNNGHLLEAELTVEHPEVELRVDLPPKGAFLDIRLTDRTTGAVIRPVRVVAMQPDGHSRLFEIGVYSDRPILIPSDRRLLLHVLSHGFREWEGSAGKGKPLRLQSGDRLTWHVELEPLKR